MKEINLEQLADDASLFYVVKKPKPNATDLDDDEKEIITRDVQPSPCKTSPERYLKIYQKKYGEN